MHLTTYWHRRKGNGGEIYRFIELCPNLPQECKARQWLPHAALMAGDREYLYCTELEILCEGVDAGSGTCEGGRVGEVKKCLISPRLFIHLHFIHRTGAGMKEYFHINWKMAGMVWMSGWMSGAMDGRMGWMRMDMDMDMGWALPVLYSYLQPMKTHHAAQRTWHVAHLPTCPATNQEQEAIPLPLPLPSTAENKKDAKCRNNNKSIKSIKSMLRWYRLHSSSLFQYLLLFLPSSVFLLFSAFYPPTSNV